MSVARAINDDSDDVVRSGAYGWGSLTGRTQRQHAGDERQRRAQSTSFSSAHVTEP
jgi:hypothetical protein